ncbi:ABC transporter permease [Frisingicoccus sp.]|uniref:ABC transporter permease n=1 Tax=Frisingicoccus sp. TaxID=1918627 RepID=UPI00262E5A75|nr:ABC transporter permease [Frisingicoccus sp.]MDD6233449.1 ABC transporter permease [Frisingicoccus sp.]MDY4835509.1 ABC transporter permease [Frisingicoccus sp.]MDY4922191.1 ABC transporter permease [Frisingicoccus sp.]
MSSNKKESSNNALMMTLLKGRTFIVLIVLLIFFSITANNFLSVNTLLLIGKHVALYGIIAIGMTYVIITGGIDLSVGAVVGLAGMVAGGLLQKGLTLQFAGVTIYFSVPLVVLITIIVGALIGVINGIIITRFNVAPFIATLGTMYICRGFANLHSNGATYSDLKGYEGLGNQGWTFFGSTVFGIPVGLIILAIMAVIFSFILKKTVFGWHVFSIGGNEKAAKLSGVKVDKVKILVYMISGICAAVVGIIACSQLAAAHPATGESWEMNAIAAAVLGGTSMAGGIGTIGGTIVGAFVIGVINDGMVMCGVSEFWQMVIKGLVIIVAVVIDQFQRNMEAKMALKARNESK